MNNELLNKIITSLIILVVFILIQIIVEKIIKRIIKKQPGKRKKTILSLLNNIIKYVLLVIAILTILNEFGINTTALVTSLGLVGLGVSLALQDTMKDFLSGSFIIFENQYDIGDIIEVNGFKGEVISLGLKTTKIRSLTGEVNIIPNRNIASVINYSAKNSFAVVDIDIAYEEDPEVVEKTLINFCKELEGKIEDIKGSINYLGIISFESSSVKYRITAETIATKNLAVERQIRKFLQIYLRENKIEIPYNKVVVHNA